MSSDLATENAEQEHRDTVDAIAQRVVAARIARKHPAIKPGGAEWENLDIGTMLERAKADLVTDDEGNEPEGVDVRFMSDNWSPSQHEAEILKQLIS